MDRNVFAAGLKIRRQVLGSDYVDNSLKQANKRTMPLQELVTEYCWGKIWSRPGLTRRVRSLLNIAMLAVLNRPHELKLHLSGALTNGCTPAEIVEVILQVAIYGGVPAAVDTMRIAREVFGEERPDQRKAKAQAKTKATPRGKRSTSK